MNQQLSIFEEDNKMNDQQDDLKKLIARFSECKTAEDYVNVIRDAQGIERSQKLYFNFDYMSAYNPDFISSRVVKVPETA